MIENYLNATGQLLFDSLDAGAQRDWAWLVVEQLRSRYPKADQWTTGGPPANYVDLRFGNRKPDKSSGSAVLFRIIRASGVPTCRLALWLCKHLPRQPVMTSATHPELAHITTWLDEVEPHIKPNLQKLSSAGAHTPLKYANSPLPADDGDADVDPDTAELGPTLTSQAVSPTSMPLNTILFGPPGTGKTYATIDETLAILDPQFMAQQPVPAGADASARALQRKALKARFDELAQAGRVRFVTFHQSFSYEDFVEGLRAESDDAGQLRYVVADGVFKDLCRRASALSAPALTGAGQVPIDLKGRRIWKMSLGAAVGDEAYVFDMCMEQGVALLGYGNGLDYTRCSNRGEVVERMRANGLTPEVNDYGATAVNTFINTIRAGDLLVVTDGNLRFRAIGEVTGDYRFSDRDEQYAYKQSRAVRWLRRFEPSLGYDELMNNRFSQMTLYELRDGSIDRNKLLTLLTPVPEAPGAVAEPLPHVLVIDEINRGSVSRIFGELITLIEASKRAGAPEALSVTLPYSKQRFSVPANVHLIGTMNTADRSLSGLDIALRRRFTFKEMAPDLELLRGVTVEGVDLGELLSSMNQRIEVLLDRDHLLGHAYFMPLTEPGGNTLPALAQVFRHQVLPLLQEYFFEDWERIAWVLNDLAKSSPEHQFVCRPERNLAALFGAKRADELSDRRWRLNDAAFDRIESYRGILIAAA